MEVKKQSTAVICLSPYSGGMELDAISFAKKLETVVETILIVKKDTFMNDKLKDESIKYETVDFYKTLSLSIITNVRRIVQKYNIKNVIFFGASEMKSLYFSFLGLDVNLIIRHSTTKSTPKKDWFHKLVYSDVNYHISTSKHLEKNVKKIFPFGEKSIGKLIYSSFEYGEPKYIKESKLTLLHTGRIADAKGQIDAIRACKVLVENNINFKFFIVGGFDESYKKEFMDFYNSIDYKDSIELVGFTDDVASYLHKSDIFIFPSYGEGISISFREALANNMICLAYDNTSFPELYELGFKFYLCEDRSIDDLSKRLLEISNNLDQKREFTANNYDLMNKLFSEKIEIDNYLKILI